MNQRKMINKRALGAFTVAALAALPAALSAASFAWNGGDGFSGAMTVGDDWVGGTSPYFASNNGTADLVFGATNPHGYAPTLSGNLDAHSLTFGLGALPYNIVTNGSGFSGILTLESTGLTDNAASAETISGSTAVALNASQTWTLAGGAFTDSTPLNLNTSGLTVNTSVAAASATFSGALSGSGAAGLIKSGPGTLSLSGTSTIPTLTVQAGTAQISSGPLTLSATTSPSSAALNVTGGSLTISSGAIVNLADESTTIDGSSAPSVTVTGMGSQLNPDFIITVGNSSQGTLNVSHGGSVTTTFADVGEEGGSNGTIAVDSGGTVNLTQADIASSDNSTGTVTVSGAGSVFTCSSNISLGFGSSGKQATMTVSNGGLISTPEFAFETSNSSVTVAGGMLQAGLLFSFGTGFGSVALTDPAGGTALTINGTSPGSTTYSGSISGTGSLTKTGASTQVLSGSNTFTGEVLVSGGTLSMSSGAAALYQVNGPGVLQLGFGNLGASTITAGPGGTVVYNAPQMIGGFLAGIGTHNVASVGTFSGTTIDNGATITPAANALLLNVSNEGTIVDAASNTIFWSGSNAGGNLNVSGTVLLLGWTSSGVVQVNPGGAFDAGNGINMVLLGGSRTYVGTANAPGGAINLFSGGSTVELNGGLLVNYGSISGGAVDVNFGGLATGTGTYSGVTVNAGGTYSPGIYAQSSLQGQSPGGVAAIQPASSGVTTTSTPITVNASAYFTVNGTDSLTLTSTLATNNNAVVKQGTGTVTLPVFATTSSLTVSAGTMKLAASSGVLQVGTLAVTSGATLDLGTQAADISGGSLSAISALVKQGFNNGHWNAPGIDSSAAASDSRHLTAIGVIQNNQAGSPLYSATHLFNGIAPGASDVLVKYTYYGDADLNGVVNGADYQQIDMGFGTGGSSWSNGDFNYDGVVNGSDFALIDNTFNQITATGAGSLALVGGGVSAAVPEPGAFTLVGMMGFAMARRRRCGGCIAK